MASSMASSLLRRAASTHAMRVSCVAPVRGWSAASPVLRGTWGVQRRAMAASAAQIKELRALTAAPLSDCKKALNADGVDGDMDKALDWLRKNGVATASKKAGRAAAEGVVCVKGNGEVPTTAVVVEVNSETDFVGRNSDFTSFVERIGDAALAVVDAGKDMEANLAALNEAALPGGDSAGKDCSVAEGVTDMVAKFRENLVLRRVACASVENGVVGSYMHNSLAPGVGRIGSLVALSSDTPLEGEAASKAHALSRTVAMHVVAATPIAMTRDTVDTEALQREMEVLSEQARMSGKPAEIVEKMVQGRLNKFYKENVLAEQPCVVGDDDRAVGKLVQSLGKDVGAKLELSSFVRFQCGEGADAATEEE